MALEVPERAIQKAILHYLRIKGYECKRNNAGNAFAEYKGIKRMFKVGEPGWPDIEGILNDGTGRYFGIEVKSKRGRLSPIQEDRGKRILAKNGLWFVARSLDEVIAKGF